MIKKINTIRNFGIFKDFEWNNDKELKEFNERNIIYGWNYTGKTTLSRIFSSLRDKKIHENYKDGEFKLIGTNDIEITQDNIDQTPLNIEVFNSEYIKENLKWETKEELNGIKFDVGENVKIREEIQKNNNRINEIDVRKKKVQPAIDGFNQFEDTKFSNEAKRIKNDIFNSLIEFNKGHFKRIMNQIEDSVDDFIISNKTELDSIKSTSIATNNKGLIDEIEFTNRVNFLYSKVTELLESEPRESEVIEILENDKDFYDWAKQGHELHQQRNLNECSFCGNVITPTRIQELNNYFSNASGVLRQHIEKCRETISTEIQNIENMNVPKSKNDFIDNCQDGFQNQLNQLESVKENYKNLLNTFSEDLDRKENGNIFNSIKLSEYNYSAEKEIESWISATNNFIRIHNDFVKNFDKEQATAREKLKKHLVASFLISEEYYKKENRKNYSERSIRRYDCLVDKIKLRNSTLEKNLKSVVGGQEELNKYINLFLSTDDINIEVTGEDKFVLKRGDKVAENLSEGEKTAISFAYFLVSLESLHRDNKLTDTIVFIDDPISSLDANHIAQVYSLINNFFFRQNQNPDAPDEYVSCFKQLFISTHNFDFFSFLKDSNRINKKKGREKKYEYYFIKRMDKENSCIQSMPKSLLKNKSEYIYLFSTIYNYYCKGCQESDDNLILLPNAIRRFLEIYSLIKLPGSNGEVDARLKVLAKEHDHLKILHHFSHFTSLEKLTKHDELLMNLPEAVNALMTLLESDNQHFDSLKNAVDV